MFLFTVFFLLSIPFTRVNALLSQPSSSESRFDTAPSRVYYFPDSQNILWHDNVHGRLHLSTDEGKTFFPVSDIPDGAASILVEHPFDKSQAYVLSNGETHYRTRDNGRSWQSLDMEVPASNDTPLSFHAGAQYSEYIIYHGRKCDSQSVFTGCADIMYYTTDGFSTPAQVLLPDARKCLFAHSSKEFKHDAPQDLILCVQSESGGGIYSPSKGKLVSSTDFFKTDKKVADLGTGGGNTEDVFGLVVMSNFASLAVQDLNNPDETMEMFVSRNAMTWERAHFSHTSGGGLRDNSYTLLMGSGSTPRLAVDVLTSQRALTGSLFVSDANGTQFTEILTNTNRNRDGFVEYERAPGIDDVAIMNVVLNVETVENRGWGKDIASVMTFDDGKTWGFIPPPAGDHEGAGSCGDVNMCALHLHSITSPLSYGRILFSPAVGYLMGVGNTGTTLGDIEDAHTFLSADAGRNWAKVLDGPNIYESGGQGRVLVAVLNNKPVQGVRYSFDVGQTWKEYTWPSGIAISATALFSHPDSTSLKFLLVGNALHVNGLQYIAVFLDFSEIGIRIESHGFPSDQA